MLNHIPSYNSQSGVVLVVSLVMLLLLTIIGMTGVQVTSLEEKMAGNSKDQNLAFQTAEAAVRAGEAAIESIVLLTAFNGTNGMFGIDNATYNYATTGAWTSGSSVQFSSGFSHIKTQPRYFVKHLSTAIDSSVDESIGVGGGYGTAAPGTAVSYFSVTARGTGGRDSSQAYIQTHYGKKF